MSRNKCEAFSPIGVLVVLALLMSMFTFSAQPAFPVVAASDNVTLISPTSGSPFYVKPGGSVPVIYQLNGTGYDSNSTHIWVLPTSGTKIGEAFGGTALGSGIYRTNVTLDPGSYYGSYNIRIADSRSYTTDNQFDSKDSVRVRNNPPSLTLCRPDTTGVYVKGGAYDNITFTVTCDNMTGRSVMLTAKLSKDGGTNYYYADDLVRDILLPQTTGASCSSNITVTWPQINNNLCKVSLIVTDNVSNTVTDNSTNTFTIITDPPDVTVSSPTNADIIWNGGSTQTISYATMAPYSPTLDRRIQLITGTSVTDNITPAESESPGSKTYSWLVPNDRRGGNFKIKVTVTDKAGNLSENVSNNYFTIKDITKPSVSVVYPRANETKYAGASCNITWTASDNILGDNLTYCWYYSTSGNVAANYQLLDCTTPPAERQATSTNPIVWPWLVSASDNSTNCYVKVQATDQSGNSDNSSPVGPFKIVNLSGGPRVSLTSPVGGEVWTAGTAQNLLFNGSHSSGDTAVPIKFVFNWTTVSGVPVEADWINANGDNITTLLDGTQGPRNFYWQIPYNLASSTVKVRVRAVDPTKNVYDNISGSFTVVPNTGSAVETFEIDLPAGWSYFSLPARPVNTVRHSVLATVMDKVNSVWELVDAGTDTWKVYYPGTISGSLTNITDGKGYMINMRVPGTLVFQGNSSGTLPFSYSVSPGWQLIGFTSTENQTVSNYLGGTCGSTYVIPIKSFWNAPMMNSAKVSENCTANMIPGYGYYIKFNTLHDIVP